MSNNGRRWAVYGAIAAVVVATLSILGWARLTRQEAKGEGKETGALTQRVEYIEKEQERRRVLVTETVPALVSKVNELVASQERLTEEVSYNTRLMLEILQSKGLEAPPRPTPRRSERPR